MKEIAYQLKLRSIGGIIIIDFIDMERERKVKVVVKPDPTLHIEQYDIVMI